MEGFVSKNSIFETEFRRSSYYANYGVDKITKPSNNQMTNPSGQNNPAQNGYYGQTQMMSLISGDDIREAFDNEFLDSTINHFDQSVVDTITNESGDKKHKLRTAFIVGGSTLLFGGISLILTRGKLSSRVFKQVNNIKNHIAGKIADIKEKPELSKFEGLYLSGLQVADKAFSRAQGTLFNISPLKDVLFEKLVREKLGLGKVCDYITNGFKKVSFGTVKTLYKSASKNIHTMTDSFSEINERIAKGEFGKVDEKIIEELNSGVNNIKTAYNKSFSESAYTKRTDDLASKFNGLGKRVYNAVYGNMKEFIKDTDKWSTFISERMVANEKAEVLHNLNTKKRIISNTPKDVYNELTENLTKLEMCINPTDKGAIALVKKLREMAGIYLNPKSAETPKSREEVAEGIRKVLSDYKTEMKGDNLSGQQKLLEQMETLLETDKKGLVEDILTTYKKILPKNEYEQIKKSVNKARKSLNKAVYNEGFNYTDKLRDLSVGSALTDVAIGTALPVIGTGIAISAADTKEKKRSVLLKYGIPLAVGIATTTTCALKLISGGKSLIFGALTSTLTNNICEHIDKKLKEKNNPVTE